MGYQDNFDKILKKFHPPTQVEEKYHKNHPMSSPYWVCMRLTPTSSTIILSKPNGPSELFTTFAMAIAAMATKVFGYVEMNIKKIPF